MNKQCRFCSCSLKSVEDVVDHYRRAIKTDNSPTFEKYVDAITRHSYRPRQMFVEFCKFCSNPPFFDLKEKVEHYLQEHLRLLTVSKNDILIRKIGDKFIEFSIDYSRHSNLYDFENPNKVIKDFIDTASRYILEVEGELRLICCMVNQSNVETNGRKIYTQACFTTGIIEGSMNNRVKEFLFNNTKNRVLINGENGSNVYFYRFQFLKIHFLSSNISNYINILQN